MAKRKAVKKKARQTTMNVSMPASMRKYVVERVERAGFGTMSEYFRHLVREERQNHAPSWLEDMIEEGLGGPFEVADDKWWAERTARLETAIKARRRRKIA